MSQQQKEKTAAEEAEKRLKAALTAKREPSTNIGSRVGSPAVGDAASGEQSNESKGSDNMVVDGAEPAPPVMAAPEVRFQYGLDDQALVLNDIAEPLGS